MKWFRLYNEVYSDPKVQSLRPELFRFWINVMCVASENDPRGVIPGEEKLRRLLNLDRPVIRRYLAALKEVGLVDRRSDVEASTFVARSDDDPSTFVARSDVEELTPHRWSDRQPECDNSAKRKRDSRDKTYAPNISSSLSEMSRDINVTAQDASRAPAFLDLDIDIEKKPPNPLEGEPAFVLPDWIPKQDWEDWIKSRKKKPSARAKKLAVEKLAKLKAEGDDPAVVLQQSILGSWTGLYSAKPDGVATNGSRSFGGRQEKPDPCHQDMPDGSASAREWATKHLTAGAKNGHA